MNKKLISLLIVSLVLIILILPPLAATYFFTPSEIGLEQSIATEMLYKTDSEIPDEAGMYLDNNLLEQTPQINIQSIERSFEGVNVTVEGDVFFYYTNATYFEKNAPEGGGYVNASINNGIIKYKVDSGKWTVIVVKKNDDLEFFPYFWSKVLRGEYDEIWDWNAVTVEKIG